MRNRTILILGARGMLAQDLAKVFQKEEPILWDIQDLDITNKRMVEKKVGELKPSLIINAAAYTNVDKAETERKAVFEINSKAVGYLAQIAVKTGTVLVHFSTDYVFGQEKKRGYEESDIPENPLSVYGKSKLKGEEKILKEKGLKYYLVRTSWLFGSSGEEKHQHKNFVESILKIAKIKKEIKVVNDQFGKPSYTLDLAKKLKMLIENKKPFGVYHLVNEPATNWYSFAKEIIKIAGLETKIIPCKTEEFPTIAKRPKFSILLNTKLSLMPSWKEALRNYLR
jgi:dTDP-4-dehydrorhamnose reductase